MMEVEEAKAPADKKVLIAIGVGVGILIGILFGILISRWQGRSEPQQRNVDLEEHSSEDAGHDHDSVDSKELDSFKERVDSAMVALRTSLRASDLLRTSHHSNATASTTQVPENLFSPGLVGGIPGVEGPGRHSNLLPSRTSRRSRRSRDSLANQPASSSSQQHPQHPQHQQYQQHLHQQQQQQQQPHQSQGQQPQQLGQEQEQ